MKNKHTFEYRFPLPNGLHARPASAIMERVKPLGCKVQITNLSNQKTASASSVLSMISCDIAMGDQCLIAIEGESENLAMSNYKHNVYTVLLALKSGW